MAQYLADEQEVTVSNVLKSIGFEKPRMDRSAQNRITRILTRLGWERGRRSSKARYWVRGTPNDDNGMTE